jgi:hypothetical protein
LGKSGGRELNHGKHGEDHGKEMKFSNFFMSYSVVAPFY